MSIAVRSHGEVRILVMKGEFTLEAGGLARPLDLRGRRLENLAEALRAVIAQGCRSVLLEMTQVTFLDSAALGELVAWQKRARQAGSVISIVPPQGRVRAIIELVHLDKIFPMFADEAEALAALGG
jgi:anti-sigma B factor antagonist